MEHAPSPHSSPSFGSDYLIQPDTFVYESSPPYSEAHHQPHVHISEGIYNPDLPRNGSTLSFGTPGLQLSGMPAAYSSYPPSYLQSVHHQHPSSAHGSAVGHADLHHQHSSSHAHHDQQQHQQHAQQLQHHQRDSNTISPPLTSMSTSDLSGGDTNSTSATSSSLPPYAMSLSGLGGGIGGGGASLTGVGGGPASTGTSSPTSSHGRPEMSSSSLVHRTSKASRGVAAAVATSPTTTTRESRRKATTRRRSHDDDFGSDDDDDVPPPSSEVVGPKRREEVRRQRIESEQRRRDELRDGYRKLKDVLPVSNQKSSKVSLLDRATQHIKQMEMTQHHLILKVNELEMEIARLRNVNETLMLSAAEQRRASAAAVVAASSSTY